MVVLLFAEIISVGDHLAHQSRIEVWPEHLRVVPGFLLLTVSVLLSSTRPSKAHRSLSALAERDLGGVSDHVSILYDHILGSLDLVVQDYDLALHELQADVANRTRVITQTEVHVFVNRP